MPVMTVGATISGTTETLEIAATFLKQIKWILFTISGATEIPEIVLVGLNSFISSTLGTISSLKATVSRARERGAFIKPITETLEVFSVAVLPESYESLGELSYNGKMFKGSTVCQGTYLPLLFEISGDRLTVDMDVILSVEDLNRNHLFSKQIKLGVFDDNIVTLPDGRDSISGTIVVLPEDTKNIHFRNFLELRYSLRLSNSNIRNYVIEKGMFILEEV